MLGAAAAVAAAIVAALVLANRDDTPSQPGNAANEHGVAHVHGLGINPTDGSLIIATHYGSFRLPADGGDAERIGDSFQDTMGFTVAGPDHFLGSGHPDVAGIANGQPSRLGLIESNDAGVSWTGLSLGGDVDFHALAFAHGQVYGWDSDSGRFMISTDQRTWETRSTLQLASFAVDPGNPDHLVATTPAGLVESSDGGRVWRGSQGPALVTLSWDSQAGLFGVDPAGAVWRQGTAGWEQAGRLPGQPQALLATPDALWAAAHDSADVTGIYRSTDGGQTWDLRYRDAPQ